MIGIFILIAWIGWLLVRAWLRRKDPVGLALLTGEAPATEERWSTMQAPVPPASDMAVPPAVGALVPRTPETYGRVSAFDRRMGDRRRFSDRRGSTRPTPDRRSRDRRTSV